MASEYGAVASMPRPGHAGQGPEESPKELQEVTSSVVRTMEEVQRNLCMQETVQSARQLVHQASRCTPRERVVKINERFHVIKDLIESRVSDDELRIQTLECIEQSIMWERPADNVAREIVELCFHTIGTQISPGQYEVCRRILGNLLDGSLTCAASSSFDSLLGLFARLIDSVPVGNGGSEGSPSQRGFHDAAERTWRMQMLSGVFDLLFKQKSQAKYFTKLLPRIEMFFKSAKIENDDFHYAVVKVTCQTLKTCSNAIEMNVKDVELLTRNVFNAIVALLQKAESYDRRASLMACMALLTSSGLNKALLAEITAGDLLFRLNEGWQNEAMVGICIISVFIECLHHMKDEDFTGVADNCLRLHNAYSSTDDYHMRERLITFLHAFTRRLRSAYDDINYSDLPMFQDIAAVLFHKATHEIQALNVPAVMWNDASYVKFVKATMPALIKMAVNCIAALSVAEQTDKPKPTTPNNTPVLGASVQEGADKSTTVVKVEEEKLALGSAVDEEPQMPPSKRKLTQIESLEICKSICAILNAGATARSVMIDKEKSGGPKDHLLDHRDIKKFIKMALKMFVGAFRSTALKQWTKLLIPVVFVMSLKDRFITTVLDCFKKGYVETFAPHMLTFILQVLKNQNNVVEYVKNVAAYSEGVIGLFSLNDWEPRAINLVEEDAEAIIDLALAIAKHMFKSFADVPEAVTACQAEIRCLTTVISRLSVKQTYPYISVATAMFKGINKLQEHSGALLVLRGPIETIVRKVIKGGANVHRDWLKLMMAAVSRGPFKPELVTMCAKPALCILRDFKWDMVPDVLEMLDSWAENLPPDEFYNLVAPVTIYKTSTVKPHFIQCLSTYLQDQTLPRFRQNAKIIMHMFSKIGSYATKYTRDMRLRHDIKHAIAIPIDMHPVGKDEVDDEMSTDIPMLQLSSDDSTSGMTDYTAVSDEKSDATPKTSGDASDFEGSYSRSGSGVDDVSMDNNVPNAIGLGIPVMDGLNSVIRQMSKPHVSHTEFEGVAVFVQNATAPMMDFSVSLAECGLTLASKGTGNPPTRGENTKYLTSETTKEFVFTMMHAMVKAGAVGKRCFAESQVYRELGMLMNTLVRYIVITSETHAQTTMDVCVDPVLVLQGVAARIVAVREETEYNFGMPREYVDPLELEVATDFLRDVFTAAQTTQCSKLCDTILTMLCLACNSHDADEKVGACMALVKICEDHPSVVQPVVLDVANSVAQLSDGDAAAIQAMSKALEALLVADEAAMINWAVSLLEHPAWYLRSTGRMCLKVAKNTAEVAAKMQKIISIARNSQNPDVQLFVATMENGDISLLQSAVGNLQTYVQSMNGGEEANATFGAQVDAYIEVLGVLLTSEEYAKAAEELEDTFNLILVWFLKLMITGGHDVVEKVRNVLSNTTNAIVRSRTLSMALEEYIFQLQTIFDEGLLERILDVIKTYKDVVDDALRESLFNVGKALIEGTLNSSINDEHQNAQFIDYMIFIASIGAGRLCADVIFNQWFNTIDCIRKGVFIPGSVAYGIWQVLHHDGVVYNLFNNTMKMECLSFFYFVSCKADVDYVLRNAYGSLDSGNDISNLFYVSLIHWLCKINAKQVTDYKHFKKLVDAMLRIACNSNKQLDDLLSPPFELDNGRLVRWKVAYVCAAVLIKVVPIPTLREKINAIMSDKDGEEERSRLDEFLSNGFLECYRSGRISCIANPVIGGNIFEMRNYQLKHLLGMLSKETRSGLGSVIEEIVELCWQSSEDGDAMGKLLAIICLCKLIEINDTPPVGAAAVLKRYLDVMAKEDVYVFLNTHHTIQLRCFGAGDDTPYTLMQVLRHSASVLIRVLSGILVPAESGKAAKDANTANNYRPLLWKWLLLNKIKEIEEKPKLMIPFMAAFVLHLHEDVTLFNDVIKEVIMVVHSDINGSCNVIQGGALDAFFGAVAVAVEHGLDMDIEVVQEACIDVMVACLCSDDVVVADVTPYMTLVVDLLVKTQRYDLLSTALKKVSNTNQSGVRYLFNQCHLRDNDTFCLHPGVGASSDSPREVPEASKAMRTSRSDQLTYIKVRNLTKCGIVLMEMLDRMLDQTIPRPTSADHITEALSSVWGLKNAKIVGFVDSCIYKMCCLFRDAFMGIKPPKSALTQKEDSESKTVVDHQHGVVGAKEQSHMVDSQSEMIDVASATKPPVNCFPMWLVSKIVTEMQVARKGAPDKLETEEEDAGPHVECHYLQTTAVDYVHSPKSQSTSGKDSPNYLSSFSRSESTNLHDSWADDRIASVCDMGSSFSNAIRSLVSLITVLSTDRGLLQQAIKCVMPEFVETLHYTLSHLEDMEEFALGRLRVYNNVYSIPHDAPQSEEPAVSDANESRRMENLVNTAIWSISIVDSAVKQKIREIAAFFSETLGHPFNHALMKAAKEMSEQTPANDTAFDDAWRSEGTPTSRSAPCTPKSRGSGREKSMDRYATKIARGSSRKIAKFQDESPKVTSRFRKTDSKGETPGDAPEAASSTPTAFAKGAIALCRFTVSSRDNVKQIELRNWMKGTQKAYPKQLLEKGDHSHVGTVYQELGTHEKRNLFTSVAYDSVLAKLKHLYGDSNLKEILDLEFVYALRHLAHHETLSGTYYETMLTCLDRPQCDDLDVRKQMLAYLLCLENKRDELSEIFDELDIPNDLYSIVKYLLSSEIGGNRDNEYYIPLYLDLIFTLSLDSWGLSFSEEYPVLPTLLPRDRNIHMTQMELVCSEEHRDTFKSNLALLREFRRMAAVTPKMEVNKPEPKPLSFPVVENRLEVYNSLLGKMHEYYTLYFESVSSMRRFKTCLRIMWHSDEEFASRLWTTVFPQIYDTFTSFQQEDVGKDVCRYLCREEHLYSSGNTCITVLQGAISCYPPINIPPEVLKYLAVTKGSWHEALYHLEKQLLSQPLDITRMATVLSDLYDRLNMNDMTIGAYRTWVITQETRLAICFLQHAKWKQAQREFNSIMESLAVTGQTAEAVSSFDESKIWYSGWVQASKQLGEWDLLRDVSFVAGDQKLFMESSSALQEWGEILPEDGLDNVSRIFALDNAECAINKVYQQLQTDILPLREVDHGITPTFTLNCARKADKMVKYGKSKLLDSWLLLPKGLCEAHRVPMRQHQRFVEVEEGMKYLTDIMRNVHAGKVPESVPIVSKWRKRLPLACDMPSVWHEMLAWRTFIFSTVKSIVANSHTVPKDAKLAAMLNLQDLQWTLTKFASVTRKSHQLPLVAAVILNKAHKFHKSILEQSNLVTEDCLVIMIERIKQYVSIPVNVHDMLKGVVTVDLDLVPGSGCETLKSHVIRLLADAINRKAALEIPKRPTHVENELASNFMMDALKLEPMLSKNWIAWAKYNDKRIDRSAVQQWKSGEGTFPSEFYENAIMGYLTAISIRPHHHWLLIGRVLTLLNEMKFIAMNKSCIETFKKYSERVPVLVWLSWLPQLISGLNRLDDGEMQHVLQLLMNRLPQQVFYALRCEYFAQNSNGDSENGAELTEPATMKRILSNLIASNPNVGTMLESFAATVTQIGRPDFVDEVLSATETVFEECLDLPFNEKVPPHVFNYLALKMPHRSSLLNETGDPDSQMAQMMKQFDKEFSEASTKMKCSETMNLLIDWMTKLSELSKTSQSDILQQQMNHMKVHQFCQHLQMLDMELQLPTIRPTLTLLYPKQRDSIGECMNVVALLPKVKKRRRGMHIVKSISMLAQNGQVYVYTVQPLTLLRQKSDQHISQMLKLFNHYALKYNETRRRDAVMPVVNVVSLDPYLCLYEEDEHDETLSEIFSAAVSYRNIVKERPEFKKMINMHPSMYRETNVLLLVLHKMKMETGVTQQLVQRWRQFNAECDDNLGFTQVYQMFKDRQYPWFTAWYKKIHQDVLMEAYSDLCSLVPDDILLKYAMSRFDNYQDFMTLRQRFTSNYAIQALLGLMFVAPYATPCKLSMNFSTGGFKLLDFRLNYSREIFVEYSKLRVFRFTRNIKTMIGPVCRMGIMPAVMYAICAAIHTYKIDILGCLSAILSDDFGIFHSGPNSPYAKADGQGNQASSQGSNGESKAVTPNITPNREINQLDEYIGRVLNYCSYLRSPTDQEQCNMPINNIITCIIDASADSSTLDGVRPVLEFPPFRSLYSTKSYPSA
ncbi:non-specific serine threonine kinase [Babesia ovata]|uniref:Non-specific serine threonine kinase n=1 Tax=Babesia ovata TaxID=189622 RepID=A0A2H6K721_9APIC|nr:non-specific serine threonine kinase [Babesia ovata]GBE58794.1 non-specific serine threonine kinase [Babesia ovata]